MNTDAIEYYASLDRGWRACLIAAAIVAGESAVAAVWLPL
jgi:hypothetical protein